MYGPDDPIGVAVADPVIPEHPEGVDVMVGGQQLPTAGNIVAGSPAQPILDQEPVSPSPLVLIVTSRFEPGLQPAATVIVKQKFHVPAPNAPEQLSPKLSPGFVPASGVSK